MPIIAIRAFTDNYIWMLVDDNHQRAICVDPGDAAPVLTYLSANPRLQLEAIFLTHHHYDHMNGVVELLQNFPHTLVYGPDDPRLTAEFSVKSEEDVCVYSMQFEVLKTPGHTSTHVCFYEPSQGLLFCGDTLFSAGCGRVFDGTIELLYASLLQLRDLPDETRVFCGHEYTRQNLQFAATVEPHNSVIKENYQFLQDNPTACSLPSTIGLEKKINPFLRLNEPEVRHYGQQKGCNSSDTLALFTLLRDEKNQFRPI